MPFQLRSPLARAVVPVFAVIVLLAAIMGVTWLVAAYISGGGAESSERLVPTVFEVGNVESIAETVAEDGPILFPGLDTTTGRRTLVLDHQGADPAGGWRVYWAYPADRDPSCHVRQIERTSRFTDCDGRQLDVTELSAPDDVRPIVENRSRLSIDLRAAAAGTPDTTT